MNNCDVTNVIKNIYKNKYNINYLDYIDRKLLLYILLPNNFYNIVSEK